MAPAVQATIAAAATSNATEITYRSGSITDFPCLRSYAAQSVTRSMHGLGETGTADVQPNWKAPDKKCWRILLTSALRTRTNNARLSSFLEEAWDPVVRAWRANSLPSACPSHQL